MKKHMLTMTLILTLFAATLTACGQSESSNDNNTTDTSSVSDTADSNDTATPENKSGMTNLNSFTAKTLEGGEYSAKNFADADVTVINIWATTCGPCIDEMPELAKFAKTLPDNVKLITWCIDGDYDSSYAKQILSESGYDGITLTSGDGDLATLDSQIQYTPTTLFVDSEGKIVGEALIGSSDRLAQIYTERINETLTALGKEEIQ